MKHTHKHIKIASVLYSHKLHTLGPQNPLTWWFWKQIEPASWWKKRTCFLSNGLMMDLILWISPLKSALTDSWASRWASHPGITPEILVPHLGFLLFLLLKEGGPLPGPETRLLSNTRKWIVWGDTCADKARDFIGKGHPVESSRVREPRRTALKKKVQSIIQI